MDTKILEELEAAYSEELNLVAGDLGALEAAVKTKMEQLGQGLLVGIFGFKRAVAGCVTLMRWSFWVMVRLGFATKNANILVGPCLLLIGITNQKTLGIGGKGFWKNGVKRL